MKHAQERAAKLKEEIEEHRYRYYVLDDPTISDDAYDALVRELEELEVQHPELRDPNSPTQRVGAEPLKEFDQHEHSTPMLSLQDAFSKTELQEWYTRTSNTLHTGPELFMDIKMDGLAAALIYEDGELWIGATRGNGYVGEDVTQNIRTIGAIPLKLRKHGADERFQRGRVEIRGEILIYKDDFLRINTQREEVGETTYANPRNLAAGSVRQLDPKLTAARPLRFHAYRVIAEPEIPTLAEEYDIAQKLGFIVNADHGTAGKLEEVERFIDSMEEMRHQLPFGTDGVVVAVNNREQFERLGIVGKAPRGAIAYKYPAEQATTRVKDIQVNVGRTGAVTPFAVLEPVMLAGTTVQMATLHNEDEIRRKDVRVGDSVIVRKAGDIIPEVVESLPKLRDGSEQEFHMPEECPVCGTKLQKPRGEAVLRCPNPNCPARVHRHVEHFVSKSAFDIDGLGERIVKTLLEKGLIEDAADLFTLTTDQLESLEGFKEKSAKNTVEAIQSKTSIPLDRFIFALGIRHIGQEAALELVRYFRSLEAFANANVEELRNVEGIGEVAAQSIISWLADPNNQAFLQKLQDNGVHPESIKETGDDSLKYQTFVVTGTLENMSRSEAEAAIRERGGNVTSSVSSNTDYIVTGENPGNNKVSQAQQYGVAQINEDQFQQLLEG